MEPTELERQIGDLEVAIDRLRSLYDQYFMGIEKLEPNVARKEVDRRIHSIRKEQIRNTALRFRFQMILQRYSTFQSHWQRICREIENGTYKRLLYRAEKRFGSDERTGPPASATAPLTAPPPVVAAAPVSAFPVSAFPEVGAPLSRELAAELAALDADFAPPPSRLPLGARTGPPLPPPPSRPIPPTLSRPARYAPGPASAAFTKRPASSPDAARGPAASSPDAAKGPAASSPDVAARAATGGEAASARGEENLPEYRVRQLYVEYVEAKRRQKESTAALTYEALAESLRTSSARLRQKHGKAVDFEVGIKDGKAVLRPRLK